MADKRNFVAKVNALVSGGMEQGAAIEAAQKELNLSNKDFLDMKTVYNQQVAENLARTVPPVLRKFLIGQEILGNNPELSKKIHPLQQSMEQLAKEYEGRGTGEKVPTPTDSLWTKATEGVLGAAAHVATIPNRAAGYLMQVAPTEPYWKRALTGAFGPLGYGVRALVDPNLPTIGEASRNIVQQAATEPAGELSQNIGHTLGETGSDISKLFSVPLTAFTRGPNAAKEVYKSQYTPPKDQKSILGVTPETAGAIGSIADFLIPVPTGGGKLLKGAAAQGVEKIVQKAPEPISKAMAYVSSTAEKAKVAKEIGSTLAAVDDAIRAGETAKNTALRQAGEAAKVLVDKKIPVQDIEKAMSKYANKQQSEAVARALGVSETPASMKQLMGGPQMQPNALQSAIKGTLTVGQTPFFQARNLSYNMNKILDTFKGSSVPILLDTLKYLRGQEVRGISPKSISEVIQKTVPTTASQELIKRGIKSQTVPQKAIGSINKLNEVVDLASMVPATIGYMRKGIKPAQAAQEAATLIPHVQPRSSMSQLDARLAQYLPFWNFTKNETLDQLSRVFGGETGRLGLAIQQAGMLSNPQQVVNPNFVPEYRQKNLATPTGQVDVAGNPQYADQPNAALSLIASGLNPASGVYPWLKDIGDNPTKAAPILKLLGLMGGSTPTAEGGGVISQTPSGEYYANPTVNAVARMIPGSNIVDLLTSEDPLNMLSRATLGISQKPVSKAASYNEKIFKLGNEASDIYNLAKKDNIRFIRLKKENEKFRRNK